MPRRLRGSTGGYVYHVLNGAVGRATLFRKEGDYIAFEKVMREALEWQPIRLLSFCLMPNQWHMVVWPRKDGELSEFFRWLTVTHTQRWHVHYHTSGTGPLYQGRFKCFPIQSDPHLLTVCRYVERNARRANLVRRAEKWRWSNLWRREQNDAASLADWPVQRAPGWVDFVNGIETESELTALRRSVARGQPYGADAWTTSTAKRLGLESSLRPQGRPKKEKTPES